MLEDLVAAAVNDAVRRVESTTQEKMGGLTAGMPMRMRERSMTVRSARVFSGLMRRSIRALRGKSR